MPMSASHPCRPARIDEMALWPKGCVHRDCFPADATFVKYNGLTAGGMGDSGR